MVEVGLWRKFHILLLVSSAWPWLLLLPLPSLSQVVKHLPGFDGPLPFHFETGYVGVGESEDVQLFYYFVKSQGTPETDPLMLWLTGGPGCSALSGLFHEIGPLHFRLVEYNGSLPTLKLNPYAWTQAASIIFVDLPVLTGFSYAKTDVASLSSDKIEIHQAIEFLNKWLVEHAEFMGNPVYIGGDSYAGIVIPAIALRIANENEQGIKPMINLKGYLVGNGRANATIEDNSKIQFAHGMALISDELYESLKRSCGGEYYNVDPSNSECLKYVGDFHKCTSGLESAQILLPKCTFASPKPNTILSLRLRRSLEEDKNPTPKSVEAEPPPTLGCPTFAYLLSKYWANDEAVQTALHVRKGTIGTWERCSSRLKYTVDIPTSTEFHIQLAKKGYRSLIYSGDHDMLIPYVGTLEWIKSLNFKIVEEWRSWRLNNQVAGYTRTYSHPAQLNLMTFATIKGAGHTAPEYKPPECVAMFQRWIKEDPL
ncbi:Serine carboxypeptidase-like 18 [Linum grandiflorum]